MLLATGGLQGCQKKEEVKFNTTALTMAFVENAPSKEMVPRQSYPVYVDISNQGGADMAAGAAHFYLSGFSAEVLQDINLKVQNANILVKETVFQEGGKERLIFATAAKPEQLQAKYDFTIKADSCYKYLTSFNTKICVGKTGNLCNITSEKVKQGDNSAAPIVVKSVTEYVQGDKLFVVATIENLGSGEVYLSNADCDLLQSDDLNEKLKKNMVEATVTTESGFSCNLYNLGSPYSPVEGTTGMAYLGKLTCSKTLADEQMREAPLSINLAYVYRQSITKGFTILP